MGQFFNLDNKFFRGINKVIDSLGLSILWMICAIPLIFNLHLAMNIKALILYVPCILTAVPVGVASTAMYYAMNKVIRHERGYLWGEFWHSFRSNFKQAACVTMLYTGIALIIAGDIAIMYQLAASGRKTGVFTIIFMVMAALFVMWGIYLFPYMARFENTTKQVLKNTILISIANLPKTIMMFILLAAIAILIYALPVIAIVMPAVYMFSINLVMEKIFRKYMTEEDIAAEDERNRDDFN